MGSHLNNSHPVTELLELTTVTLVRLEGIVAYLDGI